MSSKQKFLVDDGDCSKTKASWSVAFEVTFSGELGNNSGDVPITAGRSTKNTELQVWSDGAHKGGLQLRQ